MNDKDDCCNHTGWYALNKNDERQCYGMIDCRGHKWAWSSWRHFIFCPSCGKTAVGNIHKKTALLMGGDDE